MCVCWLGAFAGSLMLYQASGGALEMVMAGLVLFYVGFRLQTKLATINADGT